MTPSMTRNDNPPYTNEKDRVRIFDTTLRDGEQSPGAAMTHEEKLRVAALLDEMGVDIIEAGFPIASNGDFEAVQRDLRPGEERGRLRSRARRLQGHRPGRRGAASRAARPRIHTFISTSPVHMKHKLQMEPHAVLEAITRLGHARPQLDRQRRVERGRRDPHGAGFPLPRDRTRDQGRRHDHQYPRHRRIHAAAGIFRAHQDAARARSRRRQRGLLHPLPQRSGPGRRQFAGRRDGGRASGGVHDQRHRRARGQCRARRDRDGAEGAQGPHALTRPASRPR